MSSYEERRSDEFETRIIRLESSLEKEKEQSDYFRLETNQLTDELGKEREKVKLIQKHADKLGGIINSQIDVRIEKEVELEQVELRLKKLVGAVEAIIDWVSEVQCDDVGEIIKRLNKAIKNDEVKSDLKDYTSPNLLIEQLTERIKELEYAPNSLGHRLKYCKEHRTICMEYNGKLACCLESKVKELEAQLAPIKADPFKRPKIVCLCGSTRFKDAFDEANYKETMAGKIVLSIGFYMHATGNRHGQEIGATPGQKIALDELHKRKIDLADEVLILNVGGYIGESTKSELEYAKAKGKTVRFLEA